MPRTEICKDCHVPHPPLVECREALLANIRQVMLRIGKVDTCKCGLTVYWIRHLSGKQAPYTAAGLIHFVDCPFGEEFSKGART